MFLVSAYLSLAKYYPTYMRSHCTTHSLIGHGNILEFEVNLVSARKSTLESGLA